MLVAATLKSMPFPHGEASLPPSTTWEWRRVKVSEAPQAPRAQRAAGAPHAFKPATNRRVNTILEIAFKGGAESQWYVKCRGSRYTLPGWMCLEDVMALVHHETEPF